MLLILLIGMYYGLNVQAKMGNDYFIQTINTVSFANETYTVLIPSDLNENIYSIAYDDGGSFWDDYMDNVTLTLTGAQVQYNDIYTHFFRSEYDMNYFVENELKIYDDEILNVNMQNWAFEWVYTFSEPSYVIVNVMNNGWFQVVSVPVGSIYFSIVYGELTNLFVENYVAYYDVKGNIIPNTSAWFSGNGSNDNRVGFAFLPVSKSDYNMGYILGDEVGYNRGLSEGELIGSDIGYQNAKQYYGINYENQWLTATEWGNVRYNEGLEQDLFGNLFDVFIALIVLIGSVFDTTVFPGVTLGLLWFIPVAFAFFKWFVKR